MGLGTFSGGGLGFGVTFALRDAFTTVASRIEARFAQMDASVSAQADRINESFSKIQAGATMVATGIGLLAPIWKGMENASDYAENLNKLEVAFGSYASKVRAFTDSALTNYGIDKIRASDMASLFGDMSTGMGMAQGDAADLSMQLVGLAGDISSFKNISQEQAQNALKGIFTGETESLKNLGIVMTQTNIEAFLAAKGITKAFKDMGQQEQVMTRFQYVMEMSKNAVGDFNRTSEGYANSKRVMEGSIKELSATMGEVFMPMMAKAYAGVAALAKRLAQTDAGKFIMKIVAIGIAFIAFGVIIVGLKMLFVALAGAVWTALAPMLPFFAAVIGIAAAAYVLWKTLNSGKPIVVAFGLALMVALGPIGLFIGAIIIVIRAIQDFNEYFANLEENLGKEPPSGIMGWFIKLGGIIKGVIAIFQSASENGWTMSQELEDALQKLGVLDFVIAIGTWIVRLKAFFSGFKEGLREVWHGVQDAFNAASEAFEPVSNWLGEMGIGFDKNLSSVEKWKKWGKIAAYVVAAALGLVVIALVAIAVASIVSAVAMLISWLPVIIVVGLVILAVWLLYKAIVFMGEVMVWLYQNGIKPVVDWFLWLDSVISDWITEALYDLGDMIDWVVDKFWELVDGILGVGDTMWDAGVGFVTGLWDGIKSMWGSFTTWLEGAISSIPILGDAVDFLFGNDQTAVAGAGGGAISNISSPADDFDSIGTQNAVNKAAMASNPAQIFSTNSTTAETIIIRNEIDGDVVAEKTVDRVRDKQEFDKTRN